MPLLFLSVPLHPHLVGAVLSPTLQAEGEGAAGGRVGGAGGRSCAASRAAHLLQHLALFHGEALPMHALALLQNAFECNHELIGDDVRWPLARVLALSRTNQLRIMQVIVAAAAVSLSLSS